MKPTHRKSNRVNACAACVSLSSDVMSKAEAPKHTLGFLTREFGMHVRYTYDSAAASMKCHVRACSLQVVH